jgi:antirestriction protein ArdC
MRTFCVFNLSQIEGLREPEPPEELPPEIREDAAERFIEATGAEIHHGGDQAFYCPAEDRAQLPPFGAFCEPSSYYAAALHELGHWTSAQGRLDRDLSGRFGTQSYAAEELVAELTSAFLCAELGIKGELRHAGYIESWLTLLRSDRKAVFTAASQAQRAADHLRSLSK